MMMMMMMTQHRSMRRRATERDYMKECLRRGEKGMKPPRESKRGRRRGRWSKGKMQEQIEERAWRWKENSREGRSRGKGTIQKEKHKRGFQTRKETRTRHLKRSWMQEVEETKLKGTNGHKAWLMNPGAWCCSSVYGKDNVRALVRNQGASQRFERNSDRDNRNTLGIDTRLEDEFASCHSIRRTSICKSIHSRIHHQPHPYR